MSKCAEAIAKKIMGGLLSKQITLDKLTAEVANSLASVVVVKRDAAIELYLEGEQFFAFSGPAMNHPEDFTIEALRASSA